MSDQHEALSDDVADDEVRARREFLKNTGKEFLIIYCKRYWQKAMVMWEMELLVGNG